MMESEERHYMEAGNVVIFYSPGDAYRVGTLLPFDASTGEAQVQDCENRQRYTVRVPDDVHPMTAPLPPPEDCDDLLMMPDVSAGPLLCSLRLRYQDERFYSCLGRDSLLYINPPRAGPSEAEQAPHLYLQDRPNLPPHPWMLAARALQHVTSSGTDAVIIVSGDQGSGKTATAKAIFRLLSSLLPHGAKAPGSELTVRLAKQTSDAEFGEAVARALDIPAETVQVTASEAVHIDNGGERVELREIVFHFKQEAGSEGARLVKDFRSHASMTSQGLAAELSLVSTTVKESKVWPSAAMHTIVEAFCHARTTRNVNATRATVLTRFAVRDNNVIGAEVRTFLLEVHRAKGPPPGERTFHVLYYLAAGASDWERQRYHLPAKDDLEELAFNVLGKSRAAADTSGRSPWEQSMAALHSMGSCGDWTADMDELSAGYDQLVDAFDACKISHRLQDWIFRVVAAILHLGQVQFMSVHNGAANETVVTEDTKESLRFCADCLQLNEATLESALTTHLHMVLNERVDIRLTPAQAAAARDTLMAGLYEKVVDITIATLNCQLAPTEEVTGWVSVLDFLGVEDGAHNDLEALAVNYSNEVLQNYYNKVVFDDDVAECVEELGEGCPVSVVPYTEVYSIVKLLRANLGVFSIIDDESSQAQPSDSALLETLTKRLNAHPKFQRRPVAVNCFSVKHSFGDIEYTVPRMTSTNRNTALPPDTRRCLSSSLCRYTAQAFLTPQEMKERLAMESEHEKGSSSGVPAEFVAINMRLQLLKNQPSKPTYLSKVKHQVYSLMSMVEGCKPFFTRCIRPAKGVIDGGIVFHGRHVMKQVNALAIPDTLKQKQMGYAFRQTFSGLLRVLWMLARDLPDSADAKEKVFLLCQKHGLGEQDYKLGTTQVFLTKHAYAVLSEWQRSKEQALAEVVQAFCRSRMAVTSMQETKTLLEREAIEQQELRSTVQQRLRWEAERGRREDSDRQRVAHEETRCRRNVDNQEAVGYITIMTGLIEGVERVKEQWSERRRVEEKNKQRQLQLLLRDEREKEERCASELLSQRMLAQGGRLDRVLSKKYCEEQRLRERRSKQETTQQRLMRNRIEEERKRLKIESKLMHKETQHDQFVVQKTCERQVTERRRLEQAEADRLAREARQRARQAWEESKRDEYDLEQIEAEVVKRVEQELGESKKRESFREKLDREEELKRGREKILMLEKLRAHKQLQREQQEKQAASRLEEEKKKRELLSWKEQQHQRLLKEELGKIKDTTERKRFARRQKEKQALAAPQVYHQLVDPLVSAVGSPYPSSVGRSPARSINRSARSVTPGRRHPPLAPPSPFVTSKGSVLNERVLTTQKTKGLYDYQRAIHERSASKSPMRPPRSPSSFAA